MRKSYTVRIIRIALFALLAPVSVALAGNPDRAGQAGATELLINPWARSSGWNGANCGMVEGLEAQFLNVAGTAHTLKSEVVFSHTNYLQGSGITLNAAGITQRISETSVIGLSIVSMDFGDIQITTNDLPEPVLGTFSPQYINIGISYAKAFSNSIYGGVNFKIIDEKISNVGAQGLAIDAGIQYKTGNNEAKDNVKFGIALKNIGTPLKFGGDGLSTRSTTTTGYQLTLEQRAAGFEIPSLLNIGASYDFDLMKDHRLTLAGAFTSNSFSNDQFTGGLEYSFREMFMVRGGYTYEKDITDNALRTTVYTGLCAGLTIEVPLGKSGKKVGIDYSYRATDPFDGVHSFGGKFTL